MNCKIFLVTVFLATSLNTFSQKEIDKGGRIILGMSTSLENSTFHVYNPPFAAKAIYADTNQAVNKYPEQLMSSAISTSSQAWIDYNTLGGKANSEKKEQKFFDFIKTMDKDRNFFELRSKFMFTVKNEEYAMVKFYFHVQELEKPQSGVYVMKRVGSRWYITSTNFTNELSLMMMRFQDEKLLTVLKGQRTNESLMNELIEKVSSRGVVNMELLLQEFKGWYNANASQKLDYFIDKNSW